MLEQMAQETTKTRRCLCLDCGYVRQTSRGRSLLPVVSRCDQCVSAYEKTGYVRAFTPEGRRVWVPRHWMPGRYDHRGRLMAPEPATS
jgi:hypothetical protein